MMRRLWAWWNALLERWRVARRRREVADIVYRSRHEAKSANICLARRSSMKHERRNARRTLRVFDGNLRYLGD